MAENPNDFGIDPGDQKAGQHASLASKQHDPGKAHRRAGIDSRQAGVGGHETGPGGNSGGDVDADGAGLTDVIDPSKHPPHHTPDVGGRERPLDTPVIPRDPTAEGHLDNASSTSADGTNNETRVEDPAFKGDITRDEASGNSSK